MHALPRSRRRGLAACALLTLAAACGTDPPPGPRPDVLFLLIDTLRADRLGCYGYEHATSPYLDALAATGVRVESVTSQGAWTGPSMVSLMLSRHVADDFLRMPADGTTLAERFRAAGYRTLGIQYNDLLAAGHGIERGFDTYLSRPAVREIHDLWASPPDDPRPLFAYIHFVFPHEPYAPPPVCDVFPPTPVPVWQRALFAEALRKRVPTLGDDAIEATVARLAAHVTRTNQLYDAEVLFTDRVLRDLLGEGLANLPRPESTVVAIASDHGECLGDRLEIPRALTADWRSQPEMMLKIGHNSLVTEDLVHVPLILSGPGVPRDVVLDGVHENVDIHPTLLELAGIEPTPGTDGRSLVSDMVAAAANEPVRGRDFAFSAAKYFTSCRSRSGLKLVVPRGIDRNEQLFDLVSDPGERRALPLEGHAFEAMRRAIRHFRATGLRASGVELELDAEMRRRMAELGYLQDAGDDR